VTSHVEIDISIQDELWNQLDLDLPCLSRTAIDAALSVLNAKPEGELSLAFVDDDAIKALNRDYRDKDNPTNVLSFPMEGALLGDVVLARETTTAEAATAGKTVQAHLSHLIVHGFLHLLGYDHMDDTSAIEMESLEIKALAQMGIDNPYEINDSETAT